MWKEEEVGPTHALCTGYTLHYAHERHEAIAHGEGM